MGLRDFLAALQRSWWTPVVGLLLGGLAGYAVASTSTPLYTSHTQLFVSTTDATNSSDVFQGSQFSQQRVSSYAALLEGPDLARRVIDRLRLPLQPEDVTQEVEATVEFDTVLINVTITDPQAVRAQAIAGALATELTAVVGELERTGPGNVSPVRVAMTQPPELQTEPATPVPARNVALGALAGLGLGVLAAVGRARLDRSVRSAESAAQAAGVPVLGAVLSDDVLAGGHTVERGGAARTTEELRRLRSNLRHLGDGVPPQVLLVTGAGAEAGASTTVANLAVVLAAVGGRVAVVDADLRQPRVTGYLGLADGPGLTNVLTGTSNLKEASQLHSDGRLSVLSAGAVQADPTLLLGSDGLRELLDGLREDYETVLLDAPPVVTAAETSDLATVVDGVLLCVRSGRTTRDQVHDARVALDLVGARLLGVVLTRVPPRAAGSVLAGSLGAAHELTTGQGVPT